MANHHFLKPLIKQLNKKMKYAMRWWDDLWFRKKAVIAGRYQIVVKLGMGSYGVAYLCDDLQAGRRCVLKRADPIRGRASRRAHIFARETSILMRLNHPALPKLYDQFRYRKHLCFTMAYIKGQSLEEHLFIVNRAFSEKESLELIVQLLQIVHYIHSRGIVHRDINLMNVLLDGNQVKLIDFGLADLWDGSEPPMPDEYDVQEDDPPEKKLTRRLHPTSDLYAIGHLLLFLLYSTYSDSPLQPQAEAQDCWEQQLPLHPDTKMLLRRLLLAEQPYEHAQEAFEDVMRILSSSSLSDQLL